MDYDRLTVQQLRKLLIQYQLHHKVPSYYRMSKVQLIREIKKHMLIGDRVLRQGHMVTQNSGRTGKGGKFRAWARPKPRR